MKTTEHTAQSIADGICASFAKVLAKAGVTYSPTQSCETMANIIELYGKALVNRETETLTAQAKALQEALKSCMEVMDGAVVYLDAQPATAPRNMLRNRIFQRFNEARAAIQSATT